MMRGTKLPCSPEAGPRCGGQEEHGPDIRNDGLVAASSRVKRMKVSHCRQNCSSTDDANGQTKTGASPCQQGDTTQTEQCSEPYLPEDIWHHIHSLMPLKDAARAACVSQSFLSSWRCRSNLVLSRESFGLGQGDKETARDFRRKIDHILRNHSGTGVRKLNLWLVPNYNAKNCGYVDKWLEKAVTPGIEELTLSMPINNKSKYEFPCTVLSNGRGDSLRCLCLTNCSFHPIALLGCLRSLTKLELFMVRIPGDELCCLLSSSSALEWLSLRYCSKVNCLKIPCHLQHLRHVKVEDCSMRMIESKAPNLSSFQFKGDLKVQVSLGKALQVKSLYMRSTVFGCDTRAELASSMPSREVVNSPIVSSKLTDLKSMIICLGEMAFCLSFDCQSMFSILGASLTLETFISRVVSDELMQHALVFGDPSRSWMLDMSGGGVSPLNKSLIKLACHILRAWLI
uniref:F-box domain-containing protein n=3 Tax=Aegilops tauschii subsp. strangulata TaxID=200361 RepID=A0A453DIR9_AEGTS